MPSYDFENKETGEVEEHIIKISEYDQFLKDNPQLKRVYLSAPSISIRPPIGSGTTTGIGSTAFATTIIANGSVTDTTLTAVGFGYTHSNPPEVLIELPPFQTEKITSIDKVEGFTGIITGITTTTTNNDATKETSARGSIASEL